MLHQDCVVPEEEEVDVVDAVAVVTEEGAGEARRSAVRKIKSSRVGRESSGEKG